MLSNIQRVNMNVITSSRANKNNKIGKKYLKNATKTCIIDLTEYNE